MKKQRKHYAPVEKTAILRRHLLDKEPISKLCDELGLQFTVFYRWQIEFFENGASAFEQPLTIHQHWHIDVSYIDVSRTFYFLCSILDGRSRYIVNWDLPESMTEPDTEIIRQAVKEKYPEARLRIISDNGPQFIAKDFKEFVWSSGMTHVRTLPYYPQYNGKIERWHKSLKGKCIRPGTPLSLEDARRLPEGYVEHYHSVRLNSARFVVRRPREERGAHAQSRG